MSKLPKNIVIKSMECIYFDFDLCKSSLQKRYTPIFEYLPIVITKKMVLSVIVHKFGVGVSFTYVFSIFMNVEMFTKQIIKYYMFVIYVWTRGNL